MTSRLVLHTALGRFRARVLAPLVAAEMFTNTNTRATSIARTSSNSRTGKQILQARCQARPTVSAHWLLLTRSTSNVKHAGLHPLGYNSFTTSCALQTAARNAVNRPRTQSPVLCQAVAEQEVQTVAEDEMRIAQDVSQLIGTSEQLLLHAYVCSVGCNTLMEPQSAESC